jgi:hypothetical protein
MLNAPRLSHMGRKKKPPAGASGKTDRHKPGKLIRLPEKLVALLQELADEEFNTATEQAKIAVREYLQRRGKLPRPAV